MTQNIAACGNYRLFGLRGVDVPKDNELREMIVDCLRYHRENKRFHEQATQNADKLQEVAFAFKALANRWAIRDRRD
jgi:hypothetical protein